MSYNSTRRGAFLSDPALCKLPPLLLLSLKSRQKLVGIVMGGIHKVIIYRADGVDSRQEMEIN